MRVKGIRVNLVTYNFCISPLTTAAKNAAKHQNTRPKEQQQVLGEEAEKKELWNPAMGLLDLLMKDEG